MLPMGLFPSGLSTLGPVQWEVPGFSLTIPAQAQPRDPIVTSDSPEYCGVLMSRISGVTRATAAPVPTEEPALEAIAAE